jgi:hypothetical protein
LASAGGSLSTALYFFNDRRADQTKRVDVMSSIAAALWFLDAGSYKQRLAVLGDYFFQKFELSISVNIPTGRSVIERSNNY